MSTCSSNACWGHPSNHGLEVPQQRNRLRSFSLAKDELTPILPVALDDRMARFPDTLSQANLCLTSLSIPSTGRGKPGCFLRKKRWGSKWGLDANAGPCL